MVVASMLNPRQMAVASATSRFWRDVVSEACDIGTMKVGWGGSTSRLHLASLIDAYASVHHGGGVVTGRGVGDLWIVERGHFVCTSPCAVWGISDDVFVEGDVLSAWNVTMRAVSFSHSGKFTQCRFEGYQRDAFHLLAGGQAKFDTCTFVGSFVGQGPCEMRRCEVKGSVNTTDMFHTTDCVFSCDVHVQCTCFCGSHKRQHLSYGDEFKTRLMNNNVEETHRECFNH